MKNVTGNRTAVYNIRYNICYKEPYVYRHNNKNNSKVVKNKTIVSNADSKSDKVDKIIESIASVLHLVSKIKKLISIFKN